MDSCRCKVNGRNAVDSFDRTMNTKHARNFICCDMTQCLSVPIYKKALILVDYEELCLQSPCSGVPNGQMVAPSNGTCVRARHFLAGG